MATINDGFSAVIPFYKAEKYFAETLDSILAQTLLPNEIIIVVDGIEAHDIHYFDQFKSDLIKVVMLESNQGVATARNKGVEITNSKWIAFLDADDKWTINKLQKQFDFLTSHKEFAGCHTGVSVFSNDEVISKYTDKPSTLEAKHLSICSHVMPSSMIVRRDVYLELGGMDASFRCCEDYEFEIRLVRAGYKIGFIREPLCMLRRENQGNLSSAGWNIFRHQMKILFRHRKMFLENGGLRTVRQFVAESLREWSVKIGGIRGRFFGATAKIIGI